jgi:ABC-type polysaccharide/polyol phosphate export permease
MQTSLARSWQLQRGVIGALLMREILTRYGRHNIGFLWLFLEPMMFTLGVTAVWSLARSIHTSNLPIVAFAVTGYSAVLLWRNMPARLIGAVGPNASLMYHRNVKMIDIYLSRLLLEAAGATMSFVVLVVLFVTLGWMGGPEDVLTVAFAWFLLAWFGGSLALLLGAVSEQSDLIEKLWHPVSYILFPLSGAAFIVDSLPVHMQKFVLLLPMVHAVELMRHGYFGSKIQAHYNVSYLVLSCVVLTFLGLAKVRQVSRELVLE